MSTYPPRHGTNPTAARHPVVACVASARVLRAQGHPDRAADLEDAAARHTTTARDDTPDRTTGPAGEHDAHHARMDEIPVAQRAGTSVGEHRREGHTEQQAEPADDGHTFRQADDPAGPRPSWR